MRRLLTLPLVAVAAAVLAVSACTAVPAPGDKIDVDSPELVEAKDQAGIDDCAPGEAAPVDGGLPTVTLPCLGGGPDVDVSSLRGPMLVSIWAYWCEPCRQEMPILQSFYADHGDEVSLLGVDFQDAMPGGAIALMDELGATYPSLADPYGDLSAQGALPVITGLPYLVFIDGEGKIAFLHQGEVESGRELRDLVREHLGVRL